jgi:putative transposase
VLESFVSKTRDKAAALRFLKKLMKRHGSPEELVTDGLRSYGSALKEAGAGRRQVTGRWENNRVENSHQPFRRRERAMRRFRRMHSLQKFVSAHASVRITLTQTGASQADRPMSRPAPPLPSIGGRSAPPEKGRTGEN